MKKITETIDRYTVEGIEKRGLFATDEEYTEFKKVVDYWDLIQMIRNESVRIRTVTFKDTQYKEYFVNENYDWMNMEV